MTLLNHVEPLWITNWGLGKSLKAVGKKLCHFFDGTVPLPRSTLRGGEPHGKSTNERNLHRRSSHSKPPLIEDFPVQNLPLLRGFPKGWCMEDFHSNLDLWRIFPTINRHKNSEDSPISRFRRGTLEFFASQRPPLQRRGEHLQDPLPRAGWRKRLGHLQITTSKKIQHLKELRGWDIPQLNERL